MQEQQEEADSSDQRPIVSAKSPLIEPSSGSNSFNDENVVSGKPGLVSTYVCSLDQARTNRQ
jgi:hypothetical protein